MPHAALFVVQEPNRRVLRRKMEVSMPHAALFVVQDEMVCLQCKMDGFNAARGFVCGASTLIRDDALMFYKFQCRTRLCLWCKSLNYVGRG